MKRNMQCTATMLVVALTLAFLLVIDSRPAYAGNIGVGGLICFTKTIQATGQAQGTNEGEVMVNAEDNWRSRT